MSRQPLTHSASPIIKKKHVLGCRNGRWSNSSLIISLLIGFLVADTIALSFGVNLKSFWGYASAITTLAGYAFYISQMYPTGGRPAVKPEPLSWALFGFLTAAGWIVQVAQGADAGSWTLGITAVVCFLISGLSYIRFVWKFDWFHVIITLLAMGLFVFSAITRTDPTLATVSACLATLADFVSYGPTFRKSWRQPHEESVTNFVFNSVKCVPALLAINTYSVATTIYLFMLLIVNGLFAVFLFIRRRYVSEYQEPPHWGGS